MEFQFQISGFMNFRKGEKGCKEILTHLPTLKWPIRGVVPLLLNTKYLQTLKGDEEVRGMEVNMADLEIYYSPLDPLPYPGLLQSAIFKIILN